MNFSVEPADPAGVTVVVATRNRAATLSRTLDRLRALPERPALIVVDNASTDNTANLLPTGCPDVRLIRSRRNLGAVARNHGVAAATTRYVAFSDDDSWWAPGALHRAAALLDRHSRLGLIAARVLVGPSGRPDPLNELMAAAPFGHPHDLPGPSVLGFLACGAVVRRDAFLAAGGFDPVVFFMGEEERLAYDLRAAGWGLSYCDSVVAHHHPAPGSASPVKTRLAARNVALTAWMRRPVPVAVASTVTLIRSPRTAMQFAFRLPRALAARRTPHPVVEAELSRLAGQPPVPPGVHRAGHTSPRDLNRPADASLSAGTPR